MSHATDLTEEDAADLQFPKGRSSTVKPTLFEGVEVLVNLPEEQAHDSEQSFVHSVCSNCLTDLASRYILCDVCKIHICLECFSRGFANDQHKNDHPYRVMTTKFVLFEDSGWTAEEELRLLDSLSKLRNWELVALEFPKRTVTDIREHYEHFYLDRRGHRKMPVFKTELVIPEIAVPYRFSLADHEDPPRYLHNTVGYQSLAGYNAPRGDFENEYHSNAEKLITALEPIEPDDPYYETLTNLQYAIAQSYNNRLRERHKRKELVAKHGLLVLRKTFSWLHRYDKTITKPVYEKLMRFMQFFEPMKFEMFMEGLHRAGELKLQIHRLVNLRRKGITTLAEGKMYLRLQAIHDENRNKLKVFRGLPCLNWKVNRNASLALLPKAPKKKTVTPLDIIGMPGFERLTEKERDMCSAVRLVPASYLELKEVLIAENTRNGHVKLQRARSLLKIDVNKTRKLYDFLVEQAYIKK